MAVVEMEKDALMLVKDLFECGTEEGSGEITDNDSDDVLIEEVSGWKACATSSACGVQANGCDDKGCDEEDGADEGSEEEEEACENTCCDEEDGADEGSEEE